MILRLSGKEINGHVKAPASKSEAHRLLIAAFLSEKFSGKECKVNISESSKDIEATINCLDALKNGSDLLPCNESGSTYRFMVPLACALRDTNSFHLMGRLPERPMTSLFSNLRGNGMVINGEGQNIVTTVGELQPGKYTLPGDISSQFITGLLMALPILNGDSLIEIKGSLQSESYVNITLSVLSMFGIKIDKICDSNDQYCSNDDNPSFTSTNDKVSIRYIVRGNQKYLGPSEVKAEGDWSNAAFYLAAGAIGKYPITVTNLSMNSPQGDKKIIEILQEFGANMQVDDNSITVFPSILSPIEIDAGDIPDLVPVLSLLATQAKGTSKIYNAARLRLKESDRLKSVTMALSNLGAIIDESEDSLLIHGGKTLYGINISDDDCIPQNISHSGKEEKDNCNCDFKFRKNAGVISSENDHRIAMMAAIASIVTEGDVVITDAKAIEKSYPSFYRVFEELGGMVTHLKERTYL